MDKFCPKVPLRTGNAEKKLKKVWFVYIYVCIFAYTKTGKQPKTKHTMTPQQLYQLAIIKSAKKTNRPNPSKTIKAMEPAKEVYLERWEGSESVKYWYWLVDAKTEEPIDGSSKRYVALDMANRWGLKIIRKK